jgi:hypothetical protein
MFMRAHLIACLALSSLAIVVLAADKTDERSAVPPAGDVAKADKLVKDIFKAEYAKTKQADRLDLAAKLLQQASETKDDPAARYVLLREAGDVAARAGEAALAFQAADELIAAYQVNAAEFRVALANHIAAATIPAASIAPTVESLVAAAGAARTADDLATALALARAADAVAKKSKNSTLANSARALVKELETIKFESDKVKDHQTTLKTKPDDPAANLAVGRFLCFIKNDWEAGVGHLAKGSDTKLKDAAEKDAKAAEGSETDKLATADVWYDLAGAAEPALKHALQMRAHHWYTAALSGLTGLNKVKVEKRIAELEAAGEARGEKLGRWATIRKAIVDSELKRWDIVGGGFSQDTFEEIPKDGGILIGFYFTTKSQGRYPGVVQPIFLTARGEVKGRVYGVPERGAVGQTVKAKPGYAVGALYTRGGGGFDAFQPIFMKITDRGLDVNDKYDGAYVGGKGGGEGTLGGDGNFIIGIHGKWDKKTTNVMALSLVSPTSDVPPKKKGKN